MLNLVLALLWVLLLNITSFADFAVNAGFDCELNLDLDSGLRLDLDFACEVGFRVDVGVVLHV